MPAHPKPDSVTPEVLAIDRLPSTAVLGVCSAGILSLPHLPAFLGDHACRRLGRGPFGAVVGWGNRRSGLRARREAGARGVPLVLLEDGFIRSAGLGKLGAPPVSLVVDDIGIYFDARAPSRLEWLLSDTSWLTPALQREAHLGLERWRHERLTKYNTGIDTGRDTGKDTGKPRILVIDQVRGDASIPGALATEATFARMFDEALASYGAARLSVRSHPDVTAGRARGYLMERARRAGVAMLDPALSAHAALDGAEAIWTVSSAIGFEAILRGKAVKTFGVPFYAGFSLTSDAADMSDSAVAAAFARRGGQCAIEDMFAAAFLVYARYADPVTRAAVTFDQAVDRLIDWRQRVGDLAGGRTVAFGFSRWKRASASVFLGGSATPVTFAGRARPSALTKARTDGATRVAVWGTNEPAGFAETVRDEGLALMRVEDGFIRSVGLGSDLRPAGSLVIDDLGIYYDARTPSRLETRLQGGDFPKPLLARAARLRERLVATSTTKYNLGSPALDLAALAEGRPAILVAEQVPGDASLRYGSGAFSTNLELLTAVRREHPDAFIAYKEHPDVVAGNRKGRLSRSALMPLADNVVSDGDIAALFGQVQAVHVISSLAGFEALCRGTPVVVWGKPFYAGWGLTDDREAIPRRTRRVTLDELVAATLILYPRYIDPISGVPCAVEAFLDTLDALRAAGPPPRQTLIARNLGRVKRWLMALR